MRRLHDTGRSSWFMLVGLIPFVGGIVLLVVQCQDSDDNNRWGPNPKFVGGYPDPGTYGGYPAPYSGPQ